MRRTLRATVLAFGVFVATYAIALSTGAPSHVLGAATVAMGTCQSAPVGVSFAPAIDEHGILALTATLKGLDPRHGSCGGKQFSLQLLGRNDVVLAARIGTIPGYGATATATFPESLAADIKEFRLSVIG
jgi:hypothetical protein